MYAQVIVSPIHRIGYLEAYRCLRERNHFGIFESARLALWLSHGNEMFPPGEFASWADHQIEKHPVAIGITIAVWGWLLILLITWMFHPLGRHILHHR